MSKNEKSFNCFHCSYSSKWKGNLRRHLENWHSSEKVAKRTLPTYQCVLCGLFSSSSRQSIVSHYVSVHEVVLSPPVSRSFSNWDEFLAWKCTIEKEEVSEFVSADCIKSRVATTYYFRCHRDGFYRSKGKGVRKMKVKGSNKIDGCCPASLKARKALRDGSVEVTFISTHVGHKQEIGRLRLPRQDRQYLARQIASKVPLDTIMDGISSVYNEELQRVHLTRRQDLRNIARDYKLWDDCVPRNDSVSFEAWIMEMQRSATIVRMYKPRDIPSAQCGLRDNDFVLIIANDTQLEFLEEYGAKCICVDGSYGTNSMGFELTTILTLNEFNEVFPCAFLISSRSDQEMMTVFFSVIKKLLGHSLQPMVFMADTTDYYCKAWSSVMCWPLRQLYCTWHVDQAWRKNIRKVKTPEKKTYVYWLLRTILQEPDEEAFGRLLNNGMHELADDPDTADFAKYFHSEYASSCRCWAFCYRKDEIDCCMHLEPMHEIVKQFFFKGMKMRRLDHSIYGLLRYMRDKMFSRVMNLPSMARVSGEGHEKSLKVDMVILETEEGWDLVSKTGPDSCSIKCGLPSCDCEMRCGDCNVCIHQFVCSCNDSAINWNLCKHVHYLHRSVNSPVCEQSPAVNEECTTDDELNTSIVEEYTSVDEPNTTVDERNTTEDQRNTTVNERNSAVATLKVPENEVLTNLHEDLLLIEITKAKPSYDEQRLTLQLPHNENAEAMQKKRDELLQLFCHALSLCSKPQHFDFLVDRLKPNIATLESMIKH